MEFATQKDIERAEGLEWRGNTFGGNIKETNAVKMAKLIKDPKKILARMEAVAHRWDDDSVLLPFVKRAITLHPQSKYSRAWSAGKEAGFSYSPGRPYEGDICEKLIYNTAFSIERGYLQDIDM